MLRLLLFLACTVLVYCVNMDKEEILEELEQTDTEFTNDADIDVSLVTAPYGFKDGENWNRTSVKRLLNVIRRSNIGPDMLRMLDLMSKAESYKKFPSLHSGIVNYFYYDSESVEEEGKSKQSGPLSENSVFIVSDPVEARLPHSIISINKMREILWNRGMAARQESITSTRKKTPVKKVRLEKVIKSNTKPTMRTTTTTTRPTTTIDRSTFILEVPRSLRITDLSDTEYSASLIWRSPEGEGRVDTYEIEYIELSESDWIKGGEISGSGDWIKGVVVPGDQLTATQGNLYKLNKTDLSGATYQFRVAGYNKAGRSEYSNKAFVRKSNGPVNLQITELSDINFTATLVWQNPENKAEVTTYAVEYTQSPEKTWIKGVEVPGTDLTATQNQLLELNKTDDSGVTYEFRVVAINMAGRSYSSVAVIYKPSYPDDLKLWSFTSSTSSANLSWTKPEDDGGSPITGYQIEYRVVNATEWQRGSEVKGDDNAVIQSVDKTDVLYEFRVTPINAAGYGTPSETTSGDKPSEPLTFKITDVNEEKDTAELEWEKSVEDGGWEITAYQVEYHTQDTDTWQLGITVPASETKATQSGLELASHKYVFIVKAVNVAGQSNASNEDYFAKPSEILKLELVNVLAATYTVHLKWSKPKEDLMPDIIGYIVEFKTKEEKEWTTGPKINDKETLEILLDSSEWKEFFKAKNVKDNVYDFIVKPFNVWGHGPKSNKVFFDSCSMDSSFINYIPGKECVKFELKSKWVDAKKICEDKGQSMWYPHNQAELDKIIGDDKAPKDASSVWLGIQKDYPDNLQVYLTVEGDDVSNYLWAGRYKTEKGDSSFLKWFAENPDGDDSNEHYLEYKVGRKMVNDLSAGYILPFACRKIWGK